MGNSTSVPTGRTDGIRLQSPSKNLVALHQAITDWNVQEATRILEKENNVLHYRRIPSNGESFTSFDRVGKHPSRSFATNAFGKLFSEVYIYFSALEKGMLPIEKTWRGKKKTPVLPFNRNILLAFARLFLRFGADPCESLERHSNDKALYYPGATNAFDAVRMIVAAGRGPKAQKERAEMLSPCVTVMLQSPSVHAIALVDLLFWFSLGVEDVMETITVLNIPVLCPLLPLPRVVNALTPEETITNPPVMSLNHPDLITPSPTILQQSSLVRTQDSAMATSVGGTDVTDSNGPTATDAAVATSATTVDANTPTIPPFRIVPPIVAAVEAGAPAVVKQLLQRGADPDVQETAFKNKAMTDILSELSVAQSSKKRRRAILARRQAKKNEHKDTKGSTTVKATQLSNGGDDKVPPQSTTSLGTSKLTPLMLCTGLHVAYPVKSTLPNGGVYPMNPYLFLSEDAIERIDVVEIPEPTRDSFASKSKIRSETVVPSGTVDVVEPTNDMTRAKSMSATIAASQGDMSQPSETASSDDAEEKKAHALTSKRSLFGLFRNKDAKDKNKDNVDMESSTETKPATESVAQVATTTPTELSSEAEAAPPAASSSFSPAPGATPMKPSSNPSSNPSLQSLTSPPPSNTPAFASPPAVSRTHAFHSEQSIQAYMATPTLSTPAHSAHAHTTPVSTTSVADSATGNVSNTPSIPSGYHYDLLSSEPFLHLPLRAMVETLLQAGADVWARDARGNTALHYLAGAQSPSLQRDANLREYLCRRVIAESFRNRNSANGASSGGLYDLDINGNAYSGRGATSSDEDDVDGYGEDDFGFGGAFSASNQAYHSHSFITRDRGSIRKDIDGEPLSSKEKKELLKNAQDVSPLFGLVSIANVFGRTPLDLSILTLGDKRLLKSIMTENTWGRRKRAAMFWAQMQEWKHVREASMKQAILMADEERLKRQKERVLQQQQQDMEQILRNQAAAAATSATGASTTGATGQMTNDTDKASKEKEVSPHHDTAAKSKAARKLIPSLARVFMSKKSASNASVLSGAVNSPTAQTQAVESNVYDSTDAPKSLADLIAASVDSDEAVDDNKQTASASIDIEGDVAAPSDNPADSPAILPTEVESSGYASANEESSEANAEPTTVREMELGPVHEDSNPIEKPSPIRLQHSNSSLSSSASSASEPPGSAVSHASGASDLLFPMQTPLILTNAQSENFSAAEQTTGGEKTGATISKTEHLSVEESVALAQTGNDKSPKGGVDPVVHATESDIFDAFKVFETPTGAMGEFVSADAFAAIDVVVPEKPLAAPSPPSTEDNAVGFQQEDALEHSQAEFPADSEESASPTKDMNAKSFDVFDFPKGEGRQWSEKEHLFTTDIGQEKLESNVPLDAFAFPDANGTNSDFTAGISFDVQFDNEVTQKTGDDKEKIHLDQPSERHDELTFPSPAAHVPTVEERELSALLFDKQSEAFNPFEDGLSPPAVGIKPATESFDTPFDDFFEQPRTTQAMTLQDSIPFDLEGFGASTTAAGGFEPFDYAIASVGKDSTESNPFDVFDVSDKRDDAFHFATAHQKASDAASLPTSADDFFAAADPTDSIAAPAAVPADFTFSEAEFAPTVEKDFDCTEEIDINATDLPQSPSPGEDVHISNEEVVGSKDIGALPLDGLEGDAGAFGPSLKDRYEKGVDASVNDFVYTDVAADLFTKAEEQSESSPKEESEWDATLL